MGFLKKSFICWIVVYSVLCVSACSESEKVKAPDFLIKTSLMIVTGEDFLEELDLKRAAYPYNIHENPAEYNEMAIYLIKMLSQEIILLSAAADKGVIVTDQEVQSAEDDFKKDYPEDSFDKMLLENAISYFFWKKRFRKNLIMDKLIDQELKAKIEITSQDIVEFFKKRSMEDTPELDNNGLILKKIEDEKELVSRLRSQKTQDQYDDWIQKLGEEYPVEINKEKLKTFLIDIGKSEERENEKEN